MELTPEQIAQLMAVLRDASTAVAVATTGMPVSQAELDRLRVTGYLTGPGHNMVMDSFLFGQLMQSHQAAPKMSFAEFNTWLSKQPRGLSEQEQHAYSVASKRAGMYCVGLGNRYSESLGRVFITHDEKLAEVRRTQIQDATARKIAERRTVGQLRTELRQVTEEWTRDWDRIANTETHNAHQEGLASAIEDKYGDDEQMAKLPEPDACPRCRDLYLQDGKPRVMPVSWWRSQGTNVGLKSANWKPTLCALHPHCRCQGVRVPKGWGFTDSWEMVPLDAEPLAKAGPFIGPRGGKWADAAHTIAWEEPTAGSVHRTHFVQGIFGAGHDVDLEVLSHDGENIKVAERHKNADGRIVHYSHTTMPAASLAHFKNDLAGKVSVPHSGNKLVDSVIDGKAKLLGKGDDGIAFQVGDHVVKVSTTVPYQPFNPGHRSPEQAKEMLKKQVETGNLLADKGVPGIQRSEYVESGSKGFQIKPWVEIPEKLTLDQLNEAQAAIAAMHKAGYALRDSVQVGLDAKGKVTLFDIGKAQPLGDHVDKQTGELSDVRNDYEALGNLYHNHGHTLVRADKSEGEIKAEDLRKKLQKLSMAPAMAVIQIKMLRERLARELKSVHVGTPQHSRLTALAAEFEQEAEWAAEELAAHKAKQAGEQVAKSAIEDEGEVSRTSFAGMPISIENPKGSKRHWYNPHDKKHGVTVMTAPYGFIRGTMGADGDSVDVFIGPDKTAPNAYVVHARKAPDFKAYDEDKIVLGCQTAAEAKALFLSNYSDPGFFGGLTTLTIAELKERFRTHRGKMIKALPSAVDMWRQSVEAAGLTAQTFAGVVGRMHVGMGTAYDQTALAAVYADLEKSALFRTVGGMGNYGEPARTPGANVPIQSNTDWPVGRKESKKAVRKKRKLQNPKDRFDLRGIGTDDHGIKPITLDGVTREVDPNRSKANRARIDLQRTERAKLHAGSKLQNMKIHKG